MNPDIRQLLRAARVQPKRRLGQTFLIDTGVVEQIVQAAELDGEETVLEIGPGFGILTQALARRARQVLAIEVDRHLYAFLQRRLAPLANVKLIRADALHFDYGRIKGPFVVVANLPYRLATPLLLELLKERQRIPSLTLMLQQEVAARIAAAAGSKAYGTLSIQVQYWADARICLAVPPAAFYPRPKVHSCLVHLTPLPQPRVQVLNEPFYFALVRGTLAYRRKTLGNNLKRFLTDHGYLLSHQLEKLLTTADIDPARRGETLTLQEFAHLSNTLFSAAVGQTAASGLHRFPDPKTSRS